MDQAHCHQSLKDSSTWARKIPDMVTDGGSMVSIFHNPLETAIHWSHLYMQPTHLYSWNFPIVLVAFQHLETLLGCQKSLRSRNCENSRRHLPKGENRWLLGWMALCCGINSPSSVFKAIRAPQHTESFNHLRRKQAVFILEEGRGEEAENTRPPASFGLQ